MFVPGLRVDPVGCMEDVRALLSRGKANRCTFATNMNEHSSRSHLVLTVYVAATDLATGVRVHVIVRACICACVHACVRVFVWAVRLGLCWMSVRLSLAYCPHMHMQ